jgi:hypothetical protein
MNPYGIGNKLKGRPYKRDYHHHPKRLWKNWWEDIVEISKKRERRNGKQQIEKELASLEHTKA